MNKLNSLYLSNKIKKHAEMYKNTKMRIIMIEIIKNIK